MSLDNPSIRRRFRPRIWMWMVALPLVVLAITYWAEIGPCDRNPHWAALEGAKKWCASETETYEPKGHFDWSKQKPVYIQ